MQQFNDEVGERRLLNLSNMKVSEVKDYYSQFIEIEKDKKIEKMKELKAKIKNKVSYEWILAIKTKDGKLIGKMEALDMGSGTVFLTIDIPNETKRWKYGEEAIKQFLKICKENHYFNTIELDSNDEIVAKYVKNNGKDYIIEVA